MIEFAIAIVFGVLLLFILIAWLDSRATRQHELRMFRVTVVADMIKQGKSADEINEALGKLKGAK